MPRLKSLLALPTLLLPLAALLSLNCGILAFPFQAPRIVATNARHLQFSVDITDPAGTPLDAVQVSAIRHALTPNIAFGAMDEEKVDPPRTINHHLDYDTLGNFAVEIRYEKPGFEPLTRFYTQSDTVEISRPILPSPPIPPSEIINIQKSPHSQIILAPAPAPSPARPAPPHQPPTPRVPAIPTVRFDVPTMIQSPDMRPALFHPAARETLRTFPDEVRSALGQLIFELQQGAQLAMPRSRPMPTIAPGAHELRVKDKAGVYRAFYYLRSAEGILILHAFVKKTQKTPQQHIDLAGKRLNHFLASGAFP